MSLLAVAAVAASAAATNLPAWTFDSGLQGWSPNAHIARVETRDGVVRGETTGSDPIFVVQGLNFPARPWQYVVIRMRSDRAGRGQLFWTGQTTGRHGGFDGDKRTDFDIPAGEARDLVIFPFWQGEGAIRQLRLDLFEGQKFEIDSIAVREWGGGAAPQRDVAEWTPGADGAAWRVHPGSPDLYAPPLDLEVRDRGWVAVTLQADRPGVATLVWSPVGGRGDETLGFAFRASDTPHTYNLQLQAAPGWSRLGALGLRLPGDCGVRLGNVRIAAEPSGPPDLAVDYLGPEDALPRPGTPCRFLATVRNLGGSTSAPGRARLELPPGLAPAQGSTAEAALPSLEYGEQTEVRWNLIAASPGVRRVSLVLDGRTVASADLATAAAPAVPAVSAVPPPRPVDTAVELCAYYFPGWDTDAKWDCLRRVAPIRKPLLGYYDESNPECVDWQIKWARENGISCFLVDWYWVKGTQHYTHWFDAYRRAQHRDQLKVAIMWANHNPEGSHSAADWEAVTKEWIARYFTLPAYYRIDGKPAVFIWDPRNVRRDVGGPEAVHALTERSQALAREAGFPGIAFIAMNGEFSPTAMQRLTGEGYRGWTTYHEWGPRVGGAKRIPYEQVVADGPAAWDEKRRACGDMKYYPLVDTGWDARPWHGDKSLVIEGRTPALFRRLLESARAYAATNRLDTLILGPLNEWGEGSYIEPNLEFGFAMYEAVRSVFGRGDPASWPVNFGPRDAGMPLHEYAPQPALTAWDFDAPSPDWTAAMGIAHLRVEDGALRFETTGRDPALQVRTRSLRAREFGRVEFTMQIADPPAAGDHGQVFWSADAAQMTEATSVTFPLAGDGAMHTYELDLKANPRWRGRISSLRLDPCNAPGRRVTIGSFRLKP